MLAGHHENKVAGEQAQADQQEYAAAPAAEPAGRSMEEKTADIQKLADLRESGALTEEEFAQQKQEVLDS
jgi:hypothetical protein